jgi:HAD superfamily hydrolase (TIGR01549 family)
MRPVLIMEGMPPFTPPRVVLFDLDDTLFDHASAARAALRGVHGAHACFASRNFDRFEVDHAACLEDLHRRVIAGALSVDEARIERFRRLFAAAGVAAADDLLQRTAMSYRRAYLDARGPVAGARDLLAALEPHVRIGIVSNNILDEQQQKLRHCGFDAYVAALVVSEEAGVSKPDPAIFAMALDRLGAAPHEAVMVGDSWAADVEGARAAGIRAIWFNRFRQPRPHAGTAADVAALVTFEPTDAAVETILGRREARVEVECRA